MGKVAWQVLHLRLSQSMDLWSAPQLAQGYLCGCKVEGSAVVAAARISLWR